jgi:molybdenum cofactor cytidylyltransferase
LDDDTAPAPGRRITPRRGGKETDDAMKFGPFPIDDAEGLILAHTLKSARGMIKKGSVLTKDDVAALKAAGRTSIIGARLESGDVPEDAAAERVARALCGANLRQADAFTGRVNLFAEASGVIVLDRDRLLALNRLDEGLTAATLQPYDRVAAGDMVATIKIIPFAVPERAVAAAEKLAHGGLVALAPFQRKSAGLILTQLPQTKASVLAKRERVMANRLESMDSRLAAVETVTHETSAVAAAIARMKAAGLDPILVFAASAITDRADVIPAALTGAGGTILHMGMPVDPGNLLMMGTLEDGDVIGVPSCAGSPKLNGFDWVLERRLAGLPVGRDEITAMSLGGLLKEIFTRPQPRQGGAPAETDAD